MTPSIPTVMVTAWLQHYWTSMCQIESHPRCWTPRVNSLQDLGSEFISGENSCDLDDFHFLTLDDELLGLDDFNCIHPFDLTMNSDGIFFEVRPEHASHQLDLFVCHAQATLDDAIGSSI